MPTVPPQLLNIVIYQMADRIEYTIRDKLELEILCHLTRGIFSRIAINAIPDAEVKPVKSLGNRDD